MKIELTISEIESFIHSYFDIKVGMKYVELNKLEVNYFATLGVSVKEVKEYSVLLGYELNWAMNLLAKGWKLFANKHLNQEIATWDTSKKEIHLNLLYIDALKDFLKIFKIANIEIKDGSLILELAH